jgi:phosphoenolpyruvate carboxykinase (GTP)
VTGLELSLEALQTALAVDDDEWKAEIPLIEEWFTKLGDKVPTALKLELDGLKARLGM